MFQQNKKYISFSFMLIAIFLLTGIGCNTLKTSESGSIIELQKGTKLVFVDVNEAKKILATKDEYVKSYTSFDRSIRLKTEKTVSEEEFLSFISNQAMQWTVSENIRMEEVIKSASSKLKPFKLKLPNTILMIKTTGAEEGSSGYCRRNAIILPKIMLAPQNMVIQRGFSSQQNIDLEQIFIHELFHIFLIHNPELREKFYKIINFHKCNPVELPEKLRKTEITNTELPKDEYYIELRDKDSSINVMPIITIQNYDYKRKSEFFQSMKVQLLAIEKTGDKWQYKRNDAGEPVLFEPSDLSNYRKETGDNTGYVIHPEEILAENFVLLIQRNQSINSKWVIEEMDKLFQSVSR